MRRHAPRTADRIFLSWLMIAIFVRFTVNCLLAARLAAHEPSLVSRAVTGFSLLHFSLIAFLLPLLSSGLTLGAGGLNRKRLALGGISLGTVTLVEIAGIFAHPFTWIVLLFAVPAAVPLALLPSAGSSLAALVAFSVAALLGAHALGNVISASRTAHRISGAFRLIFTGALLAILFSNPDFQWSSDSVRIFLFQRPMLLLDQAGGGFLGAVGSWSPSEWMVHGWAAASVASMIAALGLYVLSLRRMFGSASGARSARRHAKAERVRGTRVSSVIYRHELRYLARSPGGVVAIGAGIAAGAWLLGTRHPTTGIALLGGFLALAAAFAYPSNIFGHDGHALRRYALLGPDWGFVFAAKNRAWLTVMGVSLALPIASGAARLSVATGLSLLLAACLVLALAIAWGNVSSMILPSRLGTGQAPAFINQVAPFALCALPFGIHLTAARFGSLTFDIAVCVGLAAAITLDAFLLRRISRSFDADVENVLARF